MAAAHHEFIHHHGHELQTPSMLLSGCWWCCWWTDAAATAIISTVLIKIIWAVIVELILIIHWTCNLQCLLHDHKPCNLDHAGQNGWISVRPFPTVLINAQYGQRAHQRAVILAPCHRLVQQLYAKIQTCPLDAGQRFRLIGIGVGLIIVGIFFNVTFTTLHNDILALNFILLLLFLFLLLSIIPVAPFPPCIHRHNPPGLFNQHVPRPLLQCWPETIETETRLGFSFMF